jgi:hypothetical protein
LARAQKRTAEIAGKSGIETPALFILDLNTREFLLLTPVTGYPFPIPFHGILIPTGRKEAMTRNLRAFGLALVAMLAFAGIAAQGASAVVEHSFRMGSASTVLTGQNESYTTGGSQHVFEATPGLWVKCDATFEGTNPGEVRDTVTVHPKYHNCTSSLGGAPSVHTSGCNFIFDSDTTTHSHSVNSSEHATASLECESAHSASPHFIEITAPGCNFRFAVTHTSPTAEVNQSLHGIRYDQVTHSSKHAITVTATVKTIKFIATSGSLCGLAGHPAGTYSTGTLDGLAEVTGFAFSSETGGSTTNGRTYSHGAQVPLTISTPT